MRTTPRDDDGTRASSLRRTARRDQARVRLGPEGARRARTLAHARGDPPDVDYDPHVDVHMQPLEPTWRRSDYFSLLARPVIGGHAGPPGAISRRPLGELDDFAMDLDTVARLALSDPARRRRRRSALSGTTSVLGRLATGNADRNGPPPAPFWQMPGDADPLAFDCGFYPGWRSRAVVSSCSRWWRTSSPRTA